MALLPKKKYSTAELQELFGQFATNLPDSVREAVNAALEDDTFRDGVGNSVHRLNESSAWVNKAMETEKRAAETQSQYETRMAELKEYEQQLIAWEAQARPLFDESLQRIASYESTYGPLDSTVGPLNQLQPTEDPNMLRSPSTGQYISREDAESMVRDATGAMSNNIAKLLMSTSDVSAQHLKTFGEPLSMRELGKFMEEQGLSDVDQAWSQWTRERRETKTNAEIEARVNTAREEGAREALAKATFPGQMTRQPSFLDTLATRDASYKDKSESEVANEIEAAMLDAIRGTGTGG